MEGAGAGDIATEATEEARAAGVDVGVSGTGAVAGEEGMAEAVEGTVEVVAMAEEVEVVMAVAVDTTGEATGEAPEVGVAAAGTGAATGRVRI